MFLTSSKTPDLRCSFAWGRCWRWCLCWQWCCYWFDDGYWNPTSCTTDLDTEMFGWQGDSDQPWNGCGLARVAKTHTCLHVCAHIWVRISIVICMCMLICTCACLCLFDIDIVDCNSAAIVYYNISCHVLYGLITTPYIITWPHTRLCHVLSNYIGIYLASQSISQSASL